MDKIYQHIIDYIKSPVIIQLSKRLFALRFDLMKIYSVLCAVEKLLANKVITKNTVLIDSSSGVYALSLALVCHKFNMKCCLVVSTHVDTLTITQLKLLGNVTIKDITSDIEGQKTFAHDQNHRIHLIQKLLKENPNMYWMRQYHDPIHYNGYKIIAEQIKKTIKRNHLHLVGPVGSGAATCGLSYGLKIYF